MIKIFNLIRKNLRKFWIFSIETDGMCQRNKIKTSVSLIYMSIFCLMIGIFFYHEAKTLIEYSDSLHGFSTLFCCICIRTLFIRHALNIFKIIARFENVIQARKNIRCLFFSADRILFNLFFKLPYLKIFLIKNLLVEESLYFDLL